jgi:hypothetical protein
MSGMKELRNFFCGLLLGAVSVYWYAFYSEDFFDSVLTWLQREASEYRGTNPPLERDAD